MMPHAMLLLPVALAMIGALCLRRSAARFPWSHARWTAERSCNRCGYDLLATPSRCPECGREFFVYDEYIGRLAKPVEGAPAAVVEARRGEPIVVWLQEGDAMEADALVRHLRHRGIAAYRPATLRELPLTLIGEAAVRSFVFVPERDVERADQFLCDIGGKPRLCDNRRVFTRK